MSFPSMNELLAFQKVASLLSFNKASEELSLSPSTLSHLVRSLEERLKIRLLNRTTRSVSLTEAGQKLFERLCFTLNDLNLALNDLNPDDGNPIGTVRISVSETAAPILLEKINSTFLEKFPGVRIELLVDNRLLDIVSAGIDAGVRLRDSVPKDMIAIPVVEKFRFVAVASPSYLKKNGYPLKPSDLLKHNCIGFRFESGRLYEWEFEKKGKKTVVSVKGSLTTNNPGLLINAAKKNLGIALVAEDLVKEDINSRNLVLLLNSWCAYRQGLYLYYPKNRHLPSALRAVINLLREAKV